MSDIADGIARNAGIGPQGATKSANTTTYDQPTYPETLRERVAYLRAENKRLWSLLRELRVHLREGSIERLRIDAELKEEG